MNNFTDDEQQVIDQQGWNDDSLVTLLSSYDPTVHGDRLAYFRHVAAEENSGTDIVDDQPCAKVEDFLEYAQVDHDREAGQISVTYDGVTRQFPDGTSTDEPRDPRVGSVVLVGNPGDGFQVYGPFDPGFDVAEWANAARFNESWSMLYLHDPNAVAHVNADTTWLQDTMHTAGLDDHAAATVIRFGLAAIEGLAKSLLEIAGPV